MPISKADLIAESDVGRDTVRETLRACGLDSNAQEYSDEEYARFKEARSLLKEKKSYADVAAHYGVKWTPKKKKAATQKKTLTAADERLTVETLNDGKGEAAALPVAKSTDGGLTFDIPALKARSAELGFALEFGDLFELLEACGCAAYAEKFNASEVDRFEEAVELLKQGKSLTEIREYFVGPGGKLESFSLKELVEQSKQKGVAIGYYDAVQVICRLGLDPNTKRYTPVEAKLLLTGFELESQGASLDQLSLMNVKNGGFTVEQLYAQFDESDGESTLLQTFQDMAEAQAKRLGPAITKLKLASVARELKHGEASKRVLQEFRDYSLARIEGKSHEEASRRALRRSPTSRLLRE